MIKRGLKKYNRTIVGIILIMLLSSFACFSDVSVPSEWAEDNIETLKSSDKFRDVAFQNYKEGITRQEFIYLAVRLFELTNNDVHVDRKPTSFNDTNDSYALEGAALGITNGVGNGNFGPNEILKREQLATLMVKALEIAGIELLPAEAYKFNDDDKISSWAKEYVYIAKANGLINGVGNDQFDPQGTATTEQALSIMKNILSNSELGMDKNVNCESFFTNAKFPDTLVYDRPHSDVGGTPQGYLLYPFFENGLLNGVKTFDLSASQMNVAGTRMLYRSLYYDKSFMEKLGKDFDFIYKRRDDDYVYVIEIVYKDDVNFMASHYATIDAYENKYGPVSITTAYTRTDLDTYAEYEQQTKVVLQTVDFVEPTREEIMKDAENKLREACLNRDDYVEVGRYPLSPDESVTVFNNVFYDRDFSITMGVHYSLAKYEYTYKLINGFYLSYKETSDYLAHKMHTIDQYEGVVSTPEVVVVEEVPVAEEVVTVQQRIFDENSDCFIQLWNGIQSKTTLIDLTSYDLTESEYKQLLIVFYEKHYEIPESKIIIFEANYINNKVTVVNADIDENSLNPYELLRQRQEKFENSKIIVNISNALLEDALRMSLNKPTGDLTKADILDIGSLTLDNIALDDLSEIEQLKNLRHLSLMNNNISDISILSKLTKLESIWLTGNYISDLTPIANLHALRRLLLSQNNIEDLSPLKNLENLEGVSLDGNNITDITALQGATKLFTVYLSNNQITDITPLEGKNIDNFEWNGTRTLNEGLTTSAFMKEIVSSKIHDDMTDMEKVKVLYDYIIDTVEYDYEAYNRTNGGLNSEETSPYGLLVYQKMVCSGYANSFESLLDLAGFETQGIINDDMHHQWTAIKLNGQWREFDATWDDNGTIIDSYFNLTHEEMSMSHGPINKTYIAGKYYAK